MPYTQKILLSLLSKSLSIPESKHFFPHRCYHAGPSHHHLLFRPLLHLLTGPCFSSCPLSVYMPQQQSGSLSLFKQDGISFPGQVRWYSPPHRSDSLPSPSSAPQGPPQARLLLGAFALSVPSPGMLFPLISYDFLSSLLCLSSTITFLETFSDLVK